MTDFDELFRFFQGTKTKLPIATSFSESKCSPTGTVGGLIERNKQYFTIRINELYLAQGRRWWTDYEPMVLVTSGFNYDGERRTIQRIVGPGLIRQGSEALPKEILLYDTSVAGPHPYRGGSLSLSIVLYRVERQNFARDLLKLVEGVSTALGSIDMGAFNKVGGALLEGLETLLGMGATQAVAAHRIEFDPLIGGVRSSYSALVGGENVDVSTLCVENGRLGRRSEDLGMFAPYRESDYVLYSVLGAPRRLDEEVLPFNAIYKRALQASSRGDEESWKAAKATLAELLQQMLISPDLIGDEADELFESYCANSKAAYERAKNLAKLSVGDTRDNPALQQLRRAAAVLEL